MINTPDEPIEHPDLAEVAGRMQEQLEEILAAELAAAAILARRQSTLRDRLLDLEGSRGRVTVRWASGDSRRGRVVSVGLDYFELECEGRPVLVSLGLAGFVEL